MAKRKGKKKETIPLRPIDQKLLDFDIHYQGFKLSGVSVIVASLGFLGLVWSIPFPTLNFLGTFNGYFNWASILIAFVIYFYYRLSPVLSYIAIFLVGLYSYCIVQLEHWAIEGGPAFWLSCLILFLLGMLLYILWAITSKKKGVLSRVPAYLLMGPLWLGSKLMKILKLPY